MDDGSTTEKANGHGIADLADLPASPLTLTVEGYCAACGTWDTHGLSCNACGYDFSGAQTADPRD